MKRRHRREWPPCATVYGATIDGDPRVGIHRGHIGNPQVEYRCDAASAEHPCGRERLPKARRMPWQQCGHPLDHPPDAPASRDPRPSVGAELAEWGERRWNSLVGDPQHLHEPAAPDQPDAHGRGSQCNRCFEYEAVAQCAPPPTGNLHDGSLPADAEVCPPLPPVGES